MPDAQALIQQIGPRLREARLAAYLTVREAADRLGIDHSMIVRYERGDSLPPLNRLIALALAYDTTPAALLAQEASAAPLIAAIDRADAAVVAKLQALLREP